MDVVRALERAVDRDATVLARHGDHRVVLDVELFLVADAVFAFEDEVRGREGRRRHRRRRSRTRRRRARTRADRRPRAAASVRASDMVLGRAEHGPVGRGDERERLGVVLDLATDRDEDRLVRLDRADDVLAGDVGGGHDDTRGPVEGGVQVQGDEPGVRVGRADRDPEPGAREDQVVGVLGGSGQLRRALSTERGDASGASGYDRARLDDDGAGRLGPGRHSGAVLLWPPRIHPRCRLRRADRGAHTQVRPGPHRTSPAVADGAPASRTTRYWIWLNSGSGTPIIGRPWPSFSSGVIRTMDPQEILLLQSRHRRHRREYRPHLRRAHPRLRAVGARTRAAGRRRGACDDDDRATGRVRGGPACRERSSRRPAPGPTPTP